MTTTPRPVSMVVDHRFHPAGVAVLAAVFAAALVAVIGWQGPVVALAGLGAVGVVALLTRRASVAIAVPLLAAPVALRELPGAQGAQVVHVLVVAVLAVVALQAARGRLPAPPASVVAGMVFVLALLVATVGSVDPFRGLKVSVNHLLGLLLCVAAAMVARHSDQWLREVLRLWTLASLVVVVPNLPQAAAGGARFGGSIVTDRAQGVFSQPNDFGEFSLFCIGAAFALLVAAERRVDRVIGVVGLLAGTAALALSFSRGSWIGATAMVVLVCVLAPHLVRTIVPVALAGGALAAVAAAFAIPPFGVLAARLATLAGGLPNPEDDRPVIYAEAVRLWLLHPVLGQGPGTFADVAGTPEALLVRRPYIHAHSIPLDIAAEAGAIGVLALLVVTGVAVTSVLRALRRLGRRTSDPTARRDRTTLAVLAALLGGVAVHGLIDVVYTNPFLIMVAWTMLGLVLGAAARAGAPPVDAGAPQPGPERTDLVPAAVNGGTVRT